MDSRNLIKQTRVAIEVLRESEAIWFRLAVSNRSGKSADGLYGFRLEAYFRSMWKQLLTKLLTQSLKMVVNMLSKAMLTSFRVLWLLIAKIF
jgi:hypothetical protein